MTMTESSPPPSPISRKQPALQDADPFTTSSVSSDEMPLSSHPTLSRSAINKSLYHTFPTPPHSPFSPSLQTTSPRLASPLTPTFARRQKPRVAGSPQVPLPRARRRSSLSTHISQLQDTDYGPPPHPAPTTPLPPIPGAPRVKFTTPAQERTRYSSYELYDKLIRLEREQRSQETKNKRHSAPPLKPHQSLPLPTPQRLYGEIQRTFSENAATEGRGCAATILGCRNRRSSIIQFHGRRRSSFKTDERI